MGVLEKLVASLNKQGAQMQQQREYEEQMIAYEEEMARKGMSPLGGQPMASPATTVIPPSLDKETMELYLIPKVPRNLDELKGRDRLWPYLNNGSATTIITSNDNAHGVHKKEKELEIALDFDGCDNVDGLIQNQMIQSFARSLNNKARSDLSDGLRERVMPAVGVGISGAFQPNKDLGERPKESRALFGIFGGRNK